MFKAHWAIFIPESGDRSCKRGKYIHVIGSLKDGFQFELVRGYDMAKTGTRPLPAIEIGLVTAGFVVDTPSGGQRVKGAIGDLKNGQQPFRAMDGLEQFLAAVAPPTKSLNSATSGTSRGKKVDMSDCQWWTTRCVRAHVEQGLLIAPQRGLNKNKDPVDIMSSAPRH
ncbi:hypothetical protein CLAFUW4_06966 [Fulvia fulva]|uniref:Uncharacterized protein n=1 Tax=Passalora fulva TaxID=5499 RepID=A0A9Q8PA77_PASFU|nr:uncharacterized protein CLAFUR5_07102 [Fulvia fulva]KAK4621529.1 hypothetical protein CLAFUR4_06975 [Fulvia fulva]KAK4622477.1 hypothetical protein CLAFUR0_06973 [Fulvia fulva]UJO18720.1 hypothetical protein CLAFUR5_07102 [Fulvia fulva]WPV16201.1 hypothetical protein CLAFUW4_06966 [Fulvia fulva]WPV30931.1 hypothetical protein CLAFUW7_06966 [Fulvia fulva]